MKNNATAMTISFGIIGLIVALSQMPWSYIAEKMANKQGGLDEILLLTACIGVTIIWYILSSSIFRKKDIQ